MEYAKLRKYEHTLAISGAAVVAFGIWSIFKAIIYFVLIPMNQLGEGFIEMDREQTGELESLGLTDRSLGLIVAVVIVVVLLIDLLMRVYIGKHAVSDGRRKNKGYKYVGLAVFISVMLAYDVCRKVTAYIELITGDAETFNKMADTANASMILDLTSLFALINVIVSAMIVKRLRQQLGLTSGTERTEVL